MNHAKFNEAQRAYDAGDYRTALQGFLEAVDRAGGDNGQACHMAGNCALKLRRYSDAETAYRRALLDETYQGRGNVHTNLGVSLAATGDYSGAIAEFEKAIEEDYDGVYKAHQGRGSALLRCGRVKDAAYAFRTAASDDRNPDPGKALVNLGVCFMAMDRPKDAVEAYRAAVNIPSYGGKGKAAANLGQAFVAAGEYRDAVRAFDQARGRWGQKLSVAAEHDYRVAREALGLEPSDGEPYDSDLDVVPVAVTEAPEPEVAPETVAVEADPVSGPRIPAPAVVEDEPVGAVEPLVRPEVEASPVIDDLESTGEIEPVTTDVVEELPERPARKHAETGGIPIAVETDFFNATEAELRSKDRQVRKEKRREGRFAVKLTLAFLGLLMLLALIGGGLYALGFGYPSQTSTLDDLLAAHSIGEDVAPYWVARPGVDIVRAMMAVPPTESVKVESLDRSATSSTAIVALELETGAPVRYKVTFDREGFGWKIADITSYFASTEPAPSEGSVETTP